VSYSRDRGYLTMAVGRRPYLEMAVDLALSLKERTTLPVLLAADEKLGALARDVFRGVFTEIVRIERRFLDGRARKFGVAAASPLDETMFIDADCLALSDPDPVWSWTGPGPLTMAGELLGPADDRDHHGFSTRKLMERLDLPAYLKTNSGVFHVRREGGPAAMEECFRCYVEEVRPALRSRLRPWRFLGDELGFGVAGGRRGFHTFAPPGPMYWPAEILSLDPARPSKPILHFIGPVPSPTLERLLSDVKRRRRSVGLPPESSLTTWRREARVAGPSRAQPAGLPVRPS